MSLGIIKIKNHTEIRDIREEKLKRRKIATMDKRVTGSTSLRRISSTTPKDVGVHHGEYRGVYWLLRQSAVRTRKMDETLPGEQIRTRRAITSPSSPLIRFVRPCDNRAFRNSVNNLEGNA